MFWCGGRHRSSTDRQKRIQKSRSKIQCSLKNREMKLLNKKTKERTRHTSAWTHSCGARADIDESVGSFALMAAGLRACGFGDVVCATALSAGRSANTVALASGVVAPRADTVLARSNGSSVASFL
jgi:hypothetical protein